jgi:hypothetical protein
MATSVVRKEEAFRLVESLKDARLGAVLKETLQHVIDYHNEHMDLWPSCIDLSFIALTLRKVFAAGSIQDTLRGHLHKHDWFEDDDARPAEGRNIEGSGDSEWGFRHVQAETYISTLSDPLVKEVLQFVFAKVAELMIFDKIIPQTKLDLSFVVESLGHSLLSHPDLLRAWKSLAE